MKVMNFYLSAIAFLFQFFFASCFYSFFGSTMLIFVICTPKQDEQNAHKSQHIIVLPSSGE